MGFGRKGLKSGRKGWLRLIEAIIAVSLLVGYLSFLEILAYRPQDPYLDASFKKAIAQDILFILDNTEKGNTTILRDCVLTGNYSDLENKTAEIMPRVYSFSYQINSGNPTRSLPTGKETIAGDYLVFDIENLEPKSYNVRLFVWYKG